MVTCKTCQILHFNEASFPTETSNRYLHIVKPNSELIFVPGCYDTADEIADRKGLRQGAK
jgi:hypothetical protein